MRDIDLPPIEPLPLRAWIPVMVVVPSLSKGDEREDEAVLAVVAGLETGLSKDVSERVDAEGSVVEESCADAEAPGEHLKRRGSKFRVVRLQVVP